MSLEHSCGIFGAFGDDEAVGKTCWALQSLQHRGQEGAGIASTGGHDLKLHAGRGLVAEVFADPNLLDELANPIAMGHVRYSTTGGSSNPANCQPLLAHTAIGPIAVAHNGDLTNKGALRRELEAKGALFQSTTDTETLLHLVASSTEATLLERLLAVLPRVQGAYALLVMTPGRLFALRDPRGFRPLVMGRRGNAVYFSSETCAFDLFGIDYEREVEPGEIVVVDAGGLHSERFEDPWADRLARCIFEHVYFARPDSIVFGDTVHRVRVRLGRRLAREHPVEADLVTSVPDSGNSASLGFALESGIPQDRAFIKNHYVGRTFILPDQDQRDLMVRLKINAIRDVVAGKRIVVVDDSIIRGTTSHSRMQTLREAGAKEIHVRISCPPTRHPCFFGVDFPTKTELIAATKSPEEIARFLGVDSLGYLSEEGLLDAVSGPRESYCLACFDGDYPVPPPPGS